jgi:hypothetical protein
MRANCSTSSASRSAPQGIITVEQIPGAIAALEAALAREGSNTHNHDDYAVEGHTSAAEKQHVGLHQRSPPASHAQGLPGRQEGSKAPAT